MTRAWEQLQQLALLVIGTRGIPGREEVEWLSLRAIDEEAGREEGGLVGVEEGAWSDEGEKRIVPFLPPRADPSPFRLSGHAADSPLPTVMAEFD
jgi:hypothetical protein